MDEKKVREAIKALEITIDIGEQKIEYNKTFEPKNDNEYIEKSIECAKTAIEALEKQLPKKPIIKTEKEVPHTHNLGRLLRFHCPSCGKFIVAIYESDAERGGGISNSLKGCSTCLQAIDFSECYTKRDVGDNKLNEDIEWSN